MTSHDFYLSTSWGPAVGVGRGVRQNRHRAQSPNRTGKIWVNKVLLGKHIPGIDALCKSYGNVGSRLIIVGSAVAEDLDVDPGQLLVLVNGGLVLGQVREPLAHGLQVALQVQDNANLNNQFSLAFHKTIKLTGLPSLKAATAQAAAGTEAFEIWDLGDGIENPAVKK